jgi:hypothetical protein
MAPRRTRKTRRRHRKQRGGGPIFKVALFSIDRPSDDLVVKLGDSLKKYFGNYTLEGPEINMISAIALEPTGLPDIYRDENEHYETVYQFETTPDVLLKRSLPTDTRLTHLEGMVGLILIKYGINDVSLIPIQHGIRPQVNSKNTSNDLYMIGLCTPSCYDISKSELNDYLIKK